MGRWSRPLARAFIEWLKAEPGGHWLEVGCGTGALSATICQHCEPASLIACDPAAPFIEHARKEVSDPRVSFVVASADDLPDRSGGFDAIVSGLVLNFLPDPARAVSSFRERLRSGGVIAAYVWDYAEGMEFLRCFWDEARALDPTAAQLDEGARFPLCQLPALASLFRDAGVTQLQTHALSVPTHFEDFDDYWTPFLRGTGPAPSYVGSLNPAARDALKDRLQRRLPAAEDGSLRLGARAWAIRARL